MLKKALILIVILICSLNLISARGISKSDTLVEILAEAKGNDIDALFAKKEVEKLAKIRDDVIEKAEETNVLAGTAQTQLRSKVTKYIEPLRSEINLAIAKSAENQRIKERESNIIKAYWQVYLAQLATEKAGIDLEIAKNNYQAAKIKFNRGSISGYALSAERYAYELKQLNSVECSNKHKKSVFSLNQLLQRSLSKNISATGNLKLNVPKDWEVDIDSVYNTALLVSEEIQRISKEADFAALKLQYAEEEFKVTSDEYLDVVTEKEKADHKCLNSKNNLYSNIVSDSSFILMGLDKYRILSLRLEMEQSKMLGTEIKLRKGHASNNEYLQSMADVLNYKHQLYSLIAELNYRYKGFSIKYLSKND